MKIKRNMLLIPIFSLLSTIAFAGTEPETNDTHHTLHKVILGITLTTSVESPGPSPRRNLAERKFSNRELLQELASRSIIPAISGYDIVELCDDLTQVGYYAHNRKTKHAALIPSDLLHYETNVHDDDGPIAYNAKARYTRTLGTWTYTGSARLWSPITLAGAEGSAFTRIQGVITQTFKIQTPEVMDTVYLFNYQSEISGYCPPSDPEEAPYSDYTIHGTVRSGAGKIVSPDDFPQD